jgi:hypothetical protein
MTIYILIFKCEICNLDFFVDYKGNLDKIPKYMLKPICSHCNSKKTILYNVKLNI